MEFKFDELFLSEIALHCLLIAELYIKLTIVTKVNIFQLPEERKPEKNWNFFLPTLGKRKNAKIIFFVNFKKETEYVRDIFDSVQRYLKDLKSFWAKDFAIQIEFSFHSQIQIFFLHTAIS